MSMSAQSGLTPPAPPGIPPDLIWRQSLRQYHEMIRAGILTDDDPVELLEGWLVTKIPKNPAHRAATRLSREALEQATPEAWYAEAQEPITLKASEPEPDVAVVRGDTRQYLDRHPGPRDVPLVLEVADTTLDRDRGLKKRLYAEAGIPVYWILNLLDRQLEVYSEPTGPAEAPDYSRSRVYPAGEMAPVILEGREVGRVSVADLLP
jgi:Uma2 family endonuclease